MTNTTNWTSLREFRHTRLTQSHVLSWEMRTDRLLVDIDLQLADEHPFFEPLRPSETACVRAATIEFPDCTHVAPAADDLGHGPISGFRRTGEGEYKFYGGFGEVEVHSGRPILRFRDGGN